ncbi:MAG: hypothetical protein RLP44_05560 [Aggregatilineales bacterium]
MLNFSEIVFKSIGYTIAYIMLSIVMVALSTLITREIVLSISDCNGMGCLGEGFLIIIIGILSGLVVSTVMMFLVYLRLEIHYEIRQVAQEVDEEQSERSSVIF